MARVLHRRVAALPFALAALLALEAPPARAQSLDPGVASALVLDTVDLGLENLTAAEQLPDGRVVILQQDGRIFVWDGSRAAPVAAGALAVDFDGGERGLLGLAIDPQFETSHRLYVYYSAANVGPEVRNRVAWVTFDPASGRVDPTSLHDVLVGIYGPRNHDGGGLTFGPDGYLYVGAGDTGCNCGCAPGLADNLFATCLSNMNGKILRIDREGGVPSTNPLASVAAVTACGATPDDCRRPLDPGVTAPPATAIWVWGLRNPWRFTFDAATGWLWIGDVGEVTWEEITVSKRAGEHHGWPFREGRHGQDPSTCLDFTPNAAGACVDPVFEYPHSEGPDNAASVTGGVFSSHCSWPEAWRGRYWFGDYVEGKIWTLTPNATRDGVVGERTTIVTGAAAPVHFFAGRDGSVLWVGHGGTLGRLAPASPAPCSEDAGAAGGEDASPGAADASPGAPDAATPTASDAGMGGAGASTSSCGCSATALGSAGAGSAAALLAAAALLRRRRR